jgi:putative inorganic carbon (hco3(-)) transporter
MGFILSLIYIALVYLSVGDMFPAAAPYRVSLILVLLALFASVPALLTRQELFDLKEFYVMIGFMGSILLSLLMVGWFGGMILATTKVMPAIIAFFLFAANCTSPLRVKITMYMIVALASYLIYRGHVAYGIGDLSSPWLFEQKFYEGPHMQGRILSLIRVRALGILNDPNDLAQFIILAIPMLWLGWTKRVWPWNLVVVVMPMGWMFYGVYLTRSRGSLLGIIAILAILFYNRYGKIASAVGPALLIVGLLALGFSGGRAISISSGQDRIMLWSDGLGMLRGHPLSGVSWGGFTEYTSHTAHNSFVLCFAELGLIGFFFYMGLIVLTALRLQKLSSAPEVDQDLQVTATVLKYTFYGFVASSWFLSRTYEVTLYLLLGMAAGLELCHREKLLVAGKPKPEDPPWIKRTLIAMAATIVMVYLSIKLTVL